MLNINKNGSLSIEIVIGMLIFIIAISFLVDIFIINYQSSEASTLCTYVSKIAAEQGGIQNNPPPGWNNSKNYISVAKIAVIANNSFIQARINDWTLYINDKNNLKTELISSTNGVVSILSQSRTYDYREYMSIIIQYKIGFNTTKAIIPLNDFVLTSTRSVISEYKERYDGLDFKTD